MDTPEQRSTHLMATQRDDNLRLFGQLLSISGRMLSIISTLIGAILVIVTLICLLGMLDRPIQLGWFVIPTLSFSAVTAFFLAWLFSQARVCGQQIQKGFYFLELTSKSLRNFAVGGLIYEIASRLATWTFVLAIPALHVHMPTKYPDISYSDWLPNFGTVILFLLLGILAAVAAILHRAAAMANDLNQII